jgi:hypothetical protein
MTTQRVREPNTLRRRQALVWIDHDQAVIVEQGLSGRNAVELLNRGAAETEAMFDVRAVVAVVDRDRVVVSGPAHARTDFERAYVAMTRRPDRLVDVEPSTASARSHR